mgnify:CR=1 FL=1
MSDARATAWWLGAGVGAALWTALTADALGFFDAGELAAAAVGPGVPHPTGFPMLLLAGQAARLIPFSTLAGRIHALGAVMVVAAAAAVVQTLWHTAQLAATPSVATQTPVSVNLATNPSVERVMAGLAGLGVALVVPAAPTLALHARQTEVYPLVVIHAAALLWVFARSAGARRLIGLAGLCGIGVGIHAESVGLAAMVWLVSFIMLARLPAPPRAALLGRAVAGSIVAMALASLVLLALPLIAGRRPALDWGGVDALRPLWRHITGASIQAAFADQQAVDLWASARAFARPMIDDLGALWLLALVAAGAALRSGLRRRQAVVGVAAALIAADAFWAIVINPMGIADGQVGLIAELFVGALAAFAVIELATALRDSGRSTAAATALVALVVVGATLVTRTLIATPPAALSVAARYGDRLLDAIPVGGLAVAASDHVASACLWAQSAEGARADAACIPLVFSRDARTFARLGKLRDQPTWGDAAVAVAGANDARARAYALGIWLRPFAAADALVWEPGHRFEDAQLGGALRPGFPWGYVTPLPAAATEVAHAAESLFDGARRFCAASGDGCGPNTPLRRHLADQLGVWGARLVSTAPPVGVQLLRAALSFDGRRPRVLHNLAVTLLGIGDAATAIVLAQRAVALDPRYRAAYRSLARAALRLSRDDESCAAATQALGDRPSRGALTWLQSLADEAERQGRAALHGRLLALQSEAMARKR